MSGFVDALLYWPRANVHQVLSSTIPGVHVHCTVLRHSHMRLIQQERHIP